MSTRLFAQDHKRIAIVGGGLAGLSTAYHMLEQAHRDVTIEITVMDTSHVGMGGASSVAGGLLHPLSPRGKLVHWGREGLEATNDLLKAAVDHESSPIILKSELYRLAQSQQQKELFQATAQEIPDLCEWLEANQLRASSTSEVVGGLRLHNGCKVIHVPSYLKGLWSACSIQERFSRHQVEWKIVESLVLEKDWKLWSETFDAVVLSAGSALFAPPFGLFQPSSGNPLPVQLVRGQSLELRLPPSGKKLWSGDALLVGKYISPLPDPDLVLVGATHEFQLDQPKSPSDVKDELRDKTYTACKHLWDSNPHVERLSEGIRVQSQRGKLGRLPIIGQLEGKELPSNLWVFTGLSSRGLLYHGIYGKILAQTISESISPATETTPSQHQYPHLDWWR